jgi:hypothetical protein
MSYLANAPGRLRFPIACSTVYRSISAAGEAMRRLLNNAETEWIKHVATHHVQAEGSDPDC